VINKMMRTRKAQAVLAKYAGTLFATFMIAFGGLSVSPALHGTMGVAEAATVSRISVEGNRRVDASTVRTYLTIQPGVPFSTFDVNESVKALYDTGLFSEVRITRQGSTLLVRLDENPIINRVAFEGNRKLEDEALQNIIQSKQRGVLTSAQVENDTQRILQAYRSSGRFNASVEPKVIDLPQGRVDLVFEINEGDKTGVSRINFIGNRAFSDGKLRDVVQTRQTGFLAFLRTTDIYDPDRLNSDKERLRQFYLNNGYADFRIISAVADLDRERNVFFITFTVDEGERYSFGNIEIDSSLRELDTESLRSVLLTQTGETYDAGDVDKSIEELTLRVAEFGYAFVQVRPRGDRNFEDRTIDVTYFIDEGPRVYVERINIRGNTRTRDYVIRREFDLAEGDAFNRVLVDRAERRLRALRFFSEVRITTEPGSSPDRIILNVRVEEQPTGEFSFGAGYSTADGIIGDISITERNFLGRGQFVRASIGAGESRRNFDFSFTEPYFMGRRVSAGFDVFRREQGNNDFVSYDTESTGGGVRLGLPLSEELSLQLNYGIKQEDITIPASLKDGNLVNGESSIAIQQAEGETITSSIGYALTYNSLDSRQNPREGIFATFQQDFAGVGGDVRFIRTEVDARYYQTLSTDLDLIGMIRARGGHVASWDDRDVRLFDSFFQGAGLVRGFEPSGIGPRDISNASQRDALGGKIYAGATAEVTFPFFGIPQEYGFRGALFADAGTLFDVSDRAKVPGIVVADDSTIRSSVGFSCCGNHHLVHCAATLPMSYRKKATTKLRFSVFLAVHNSNAIKHSLNHTRHAILCLRALLFIKYLICRYSGKQMSSFFPLSSKMSLSDIIDITGASVDESYTSRPLEISGLAPLDLAAENDMSFLDNVKYASALETTKASAVFVASKHVSRVPKAITAFVTPEPYRAYAKLGAVMFPTSVKPHPLLGHDLYNRMSHRAYISESAVIGDNVTIEPGAHIGDNVIIGNGTVISTNAVIGHHTQIGCHSSIGPNATIQCAHIGSNVTIHAGASIGQDGFGFAMGPQGHLKVPQIGRVVIHDHVEIGANTTIDRGANRDTIIGEGTKIDNLVQIAHNVQIGKHCVIVGQAGISGSTILEDFVVLGGQVGTVGHVRIGAGSQIAGSSNVKDDVPAGSKWGGTPAKPVRDWFREMTVLKRLAERDKNTAKEKGKS
jgi:outer membrane protein insertion porin family